MEDFRGGFTVHAVQHFRAQSHGCKLVPQNVVVHQVEQSQQSKYRVEFSS